MTKKRKIHRGSLIHILDISKIEAGKLTIERIESSLNQVLVDIDSMMQIRAGEKGIEFRTIFDTPVPAHIIADPTRLRQCLVNLTGNAIKFTDSGHVHLHVSSKDSKNDTLLKFDVEDTGIGID